MGIDRITEAVTALNEAGVRAERGYPAGWMPCVSGVVAAVCMEKATAEKTVLAVYVCTAESGAVCEDGAWQVVQILSGMGAQCTLEACVFQSKTELFVCRVLVQWQAGTACQVKIGSKTLEYVENVRAEKVISRVKVTDAQTGEETEECEDLGWSVRIEELLPNSVQPEEDQDDKFDLYLYRPAGGERYTDCQWVEILLEEVPAGLRRVRVARSWEPRRLLA